MTNHSVSSAAGTLQASVKSCYQFSAAPFFRSGYPGMSRERLSILWLMPMPASPPRFGGQMRMHGLATAIAARHDVTAVSLAEASFDAEASARAMRGYCRSVILVPSPRPVDGGGKRFLQLRSLASLRSFESHRYELPAFQAAIDQAFARTRFDVVNVEFPYLMRYRFSAQPGSAAPPVVLDAHEIEYDILRQTVVSESGVARRVYNVLNWRKMQREERAAFRAADAIAVCSLDDQRRVLADAPGARTAVVQNGADVDYFRPRPGDPAPDGRTVLFFGTMGYHPNVDGVLFLLREVWPRIAKQHPHARLKIVGLRPPPTILEYRSPRVEVTGFVEDLRPHLASASVVVAPLRLGGGTRLKIIEGMAMARPIVSTRIGAEGIEAVPERDLLIADEPEMFAAAVGRILDDPALGFRLGAAGRRLVESRYSWQAASIELAGLFHASIEARRRG
jgi:glycosyltransferase involved in cell wall biosynthesis